MKQRLTLLTALLLVAACTQPAPVAPPLTPGPSSSASVAPSVSVSPSATVSESPSASPSAAPAQAFEGVALKPYKFNWISGVYRDPAIDQLFVIDARNETDTPRHYLLRKFQSDGTFISTIQLTPEGQEAPEEVGGLTFDLRGFPVFAYKEDRVFQLMKLITAAVVRIPQGEHPLTDLRRAGATAVSNEGAEILVAAVSLELDEELPESQREETGGQVIYGRGEEGEVPTFLFNVPDPLFPTVRMAFAPGGNLYLAGPTRENKLALMRLKADRSLQTLPTALSAVPDQLVTGPNGDVYMAFNNASGAARLRILDAEGAPKSEHDLTLKDGGFVSTVQGMSVDAEGGLFVGGLAFNAARQTVTGLYRFRRPES